MPGIDQLRIRKMTPRNIQIMERLILGEKPTQIAKDLSITPGRVSIIVNSPLFKIELRKRLIKQAQKITDIKETILDGTLAGVRLHTEVVGNKVAGQPASIEDRIKSATVLASLGMRLIERAETPLTPPLTRDDHKSYEERLREITVREVTRTPLPDQDGPVPETNQEPLGEIVEILSRDLPPDDLIEAENQIVDDEFTEAVLKEASI